MDGLTVATSKLQVGGSISRMISIVKELGWYFFACIGDVDRACKRRVNVQPIRACRSGAGPC